MKRQSVSSCKGPSTRPSTRSQPFSARSAQYVAGAAVLATAMLLAACSSPDPQAIDYKSDSTKAKVSKTPSLAAPPDLLSDPAGATDAPAGGEASLAGYQTSSGTPVMSATQVLPASQGMHIVRDGDQRWLVVAATMPADQVWNQIRAFWQSQGYFLVEDSRQRGVMQTDWLETHTKVDQGIIRNTLTFATKNNNVTGERNRFRTRVEAGPQGQTYVFISQQGLHQVLSGSNNDSSQWETTPNDPGIEADFLVRLERSLAQGPQRSVITQEAEAAEAAKKPVAMPSHSEPRGPAPVVLPAGATPTQDGLVLQEDYNHAWARVGAGLDRAHFTVDSRDPARGLYTVRYVDPNDLGTDAQGFWNQLFHGKNEKVAKQYQINVRALTESQTRVVMVNAEGEPDGSPLAQRIMRLLVSEM